MSTCYINRYTSVDPPPISWACANLTMKQKDYKLLLPELTDWFYVFTRENKVVGIVATTQNIIKRYMFYRVQGFVYFFQRLLDYMAQIYGPWIIDVADNDTFVASIVDGYKSEPVVSGWKRFFGVKTLTT